MRHGSLFSGIGGFDLAAQWMGWENVFQVEWDSFCQKVLAKNFPNVTRYGDIKEFDGTKYRGLIDIISGGFPCQDISIAQVGRGRAKGIKGERSGMWFEYARVIREIRPKYIVFENSPMLTSRGLESVIAELSKCGYMCEWRYFYATQFGQRHRRKRLYGLAYPISNGFIDFARKGGFLQKILPERTSRQDGLPRNFKRFNKSSNFENVRIDDGISRELDKDRIKACGNSIIPQIAYQIFKAIEQYETINQ